MVEVSGWDKKFEMVEVEVLGWCWSSKSSFDFEVGSWISMLKVMFYFEIRNVNFMLKYKAWRSILNFDDSYEVEVWIQVTIWFWKEWSKLKIDVIS